VLDDLKGTYPFAPQRGATSTPDGRYFFIAEGGSVAICDTVDGAGAPNQPGMETELKRPVVGRHGAMPVRILLDPEAQDPPIDGPNDVLYLPAGRSGFWVMGADVRPGVGFPNPATRIDDSGNNDPQVQKSRRWCSDVAWFEVGGVKYLAVLFQKVDQNRLRIYDMNAVRAVANSGGPETGQELQALLDVKLNKHPSPATIYSLATPAAEVMSGSLALGLDVDVVDADTVDLYVAMGPHGLAKVRVADNLGLGAAVTWGPVFGDGTSYAGQHPRYGNYVMSLKDDSTNPATYVLERAEAPVFADVVVQNDSVGHYLYAAVDHLNWLRFDLANQTWGPDMPIDHHEGTDIQSSWDEDQMRLVPVPTQGLDKGPYSFVRQIAIAQHPTYGPILAVSGHRNPFWKGNLQYTEGPPYDTNIEGGGTSANAPAKNRTALYLLNKTFTNLDYNVDTWVEFGGRMLSFPPIQSDPTVVVLFHHLGIDKDKVNSMREFSSTGSCKIGLRPEIQPTMPADPDANSNWVIIRDENEVLGSNCYSLGISEQRPELLLLGSHDAGSEQDGHIVTVPGVGTEVNFELREQLPGKREDSYVLPLIGEGASQWVNPANSNEFIAWGVRINPFYDSDPNQQDDQLEPQWTAQFIDWSQTVPVETKRVFVAGVDDRFDQQGRHYYMSTGINKLMDAQYVGLPAQNNATKQLFALNMGIRTPQAIVVVSREQVQGGIGGAGNEDMLEFPQHLTVLRRLNTHPEYDWVDETAAGAKQWWLSGVTDVADLLGAHGAIFNFPPKFFPVWNDATGDMKAWVLAAPCGKVWSDENWPGMEDPVDWGTPDPYWVARQGQAMVQFWPVEVVDSGGNPGGTPDHLDVGIDPEGNTRLPRFFGPGDGMAIDVESVLLNRADGTPGSYCLVADWGGRLAITDITEILSGAPNTDLAVDWLWDDSPPSTLDNRPQNITSVCVDKVSADKAYLYVGVRRTGIQILKFKPNDVGNELTEVKVLQTTSSPFGMVLRDEAGVKHLLVADSHGGLRVYGKK
jgi:hypothetical protein